MSAIASVYNKLVGSIIILSLVQCSHQQKPMIPYYNTPDYTAIWLTDKQQLNQKVPHTVGAFSFTDQDDQIVDEAVVKGKIHVANFFFTSCNSICPQMTDHLKMVQSAFDKDTNVLLLSYSVTPWIDSVPRLQRYAKKFSIESSKWHLLTGPTSEIYAHARKDYFAEQQTDYNKEII